MVARMNDLARRLRRRSTPAERILWQLIRNRQLDGFKFRRQYPIGRYIVDFVCIEARLVIELDGAQHYPRPMTDEVRDRWLVSVGYTILRFANGEIVHEPDRVLEVIYRSLL